MKIFCTGASGYIGGSVAARLAADGHQVSGLVRSADKAETVRTVGIEPVMGTLDDAVTLARAAREADVVPAKAGTLNQRALLFSKAVAPALRSNSHLWLWVPAQGRDDTEFVAPSSPRHCERSEAIHRAAYAGRWIASLRSQ